MNEIRKKKKSKTTYVFMHDKKNQHEILQHYWTSKWWSNLSYQHYHCWTLLLSLVPLPASNIWSKSVDKLTTSILFLLLVRCSITSSIFKGGLRIILLPLSSSDIFSLVGFLVCFYLKTVAFEAEWRSDEAVDGLPGDDGVKVDWVFKDEVSVGVGGKDVGGVTLPILKVGRPFAVKREFRTVW